MKKITHLMKLIVLLMPLFCVQVKAFYSMSLPKNTTQIVNLIERKHPNLKININPNIIEVPLSNEDDVPFLVVWEEEQGCIVLTSGHVPVVIDGNFYKKLHSANQEARGMPFFEYDDSKKMIVPFTYYCGKYDDDRFGYVLEQFESTFNKLLQREILSEYIDY